MGKMNKITIAASGVVLALVCGASLFTDVAMAQTNGVKIVQPDKTYKMYWGNNKEGDKNFADPTQAPVISDIDVDQNFIYVGADDRRVYKIDMNNDYTSDDEQKLFYDDPVSEPINEKAPDPVFGQSDSWIRAVEVSPQGGTMATLSQNGELRICDLQSGNFRTFIKTNESEDSMDFNPSGLKGTHALVYSPDGNRIAITSNSRERSKVNIYDLTKTSNGKAIPESTAEAPKGSRTALVFSHAGDKLAVGGIDGTVFVYDVSQKTPVRIGSAKFGGKAQRRVRALAFSADDTLLAVGGDQGAIEVWNVVNPRRITIVATLELPGASIVESLKNNEGSGVFLTSDSSKPSASQQGGKVFALDFCQTNNRLVSGDSLNRVIFWDVAAKKYLSIGNEHTGTVTCLKYLDKNPIDLSGAPCVLSGSYDTTVRLWKFE